MQFVVKCFLHTLTGDMLVKIALWIQKAYADEGQTQIAGLFAVVARKDTQAARVDRERLVYAKLCREVGDGAMGEFRVVA